METQPKKRQRALFPKLDCYKNFIVDIQAQLKTGVWQAIDSEMYSIHNVRKSSLAVMVDLKCLERKNSGKGNRSFVYRRLPALINLTCAVLMQAVDEREIEMKRVKSEEQALTLFEEPQPETVVLPFESPGQYLVCLLGSDKAYTVVASEARHEDCMNFIKEHAEPRSLHAIFRLECVVHMEVQSKTFFIK